MKKKVAVLVLGVFMLSLVPGMALAGNSDFMVREVVVGMKGKIKDSYGNGKGQFKKRVKILEHEFTDVAGDWAREEIAEATVKGFVYGYEDFTFQPNKPVTCLETIVLLIRTAGLEEQVENYELTAEQEALLKKIPEWGMPYVALALEQGILTEEEIDTFNPQQGAKRYEVCQYMYRLLNAVEGEGLTATEDDGEDFVDEEQIPLRVRQHVRLMRSLGIINGYPDGTFNPMRVVKRNEITVMLNRMDRNCLQVFNQDIIDGEFQCIEVIEGGFEITVENGDGEQVKVQTNEQTKIFFRGKLYDISDDIEAGSRLRIITDGDGNAVLIRVISAGGDQQDEEQEDTDNADEQEEENQV
ncbi:MAG: S-layer homology domain-containing protein [Syntrophomonadaceae bacterium]|nr:S-layer homology domain-containing protein [Syntrophomonadaceae bacterium]